MSSQPPGTFLPNTKVTVGNHKVYIEKYLSEGGFAHVYVVRIPRENNKHELAVLKRVAVPDKEHLANMRTEVETMKKLKGHTKIVTYYDSHASQLKGGGYEVFLLMEYCNGGGLIDFMNTRLQHRLTEPEILKIFGDCAEGVATMHYLKPPLLHRDLKVENVLISKTANGTPVYKICDFGSAAQPRPAAKTAEEGRLIEEDVQKHTTMQYRSPEMIDVWRKQPINEKADIWALGVLLYKLCYYTTPFEAVGQMAILNATFKYPSYPPFSDRLKRLIGWMLKEDPRNRPNIYQVIKEVCSMRGSEIPIKDIYANRTHSEARRNESLPSSDAVSTAPVGLQKTAPQVQVQHIPDITPMRRGRLPAPTQQAAAPAKAPPSPARGDPFAALDSKNYDVRAGAVDELSKRFPSVDEFAIAHDGGKFSFPPTSPPSSSTKTDDSNNLSQRVTNALADEVFSPRVPASPAPTASSKASRVPTTSTSGRVAQKIEAVQGSPEKSESAVTSTGKEHSSRPVAQQVQQFNQIEQPSPIRPGFNYKSTAVGSSPPPGSTKKPPNVTDRSIWRVPEPNRPSSQPHASQEAQAVASSLKPSLWPTQRPALLDVHRSKSQIGTLTVDHASSSSRPSLEGGRPSAHELADGGIHRAKSLNARSRPTSMYVSSNMDYLRDQEQQRKRPPLELRRHSRHASQSRDPTSDEAAIEDDMEFLRDGEVSSDHRRMLKGSHHRKRSSLGEIGKKFGNAFKRFEHNDSKRTQGFATPETHDTGDGTQMLSPITGSEATPSRHSDMNSEIDETEDLPPDVKRELERQKLAAEEKRVAAAAEEYRTKVANQGPGNAMPSRASTIQKRVQSLLDEGRQSPQPRRTAEGYGRYTEPSDGEQRQTPLQQLPMPSGTRPPIIAPKPAINPNSTGNPYMKTRQVPSDSHPASAPPPPTISATESAPLQRVLSRPSAPPKPTVLRTGTGPRASVKPPHDPVKAVQPEQTGRLAALLAKDLEGVPDYSAASGFPQSQAQNNLMEFSPTSPEDLESFSKRVPRSAPIVGITGLVLASSWSTSSAQLNSSKSMSTSKEWPVTQYTPRHKTWPYNPLDFTREDTSNDAGFYSAPRFVTHIDDAAIATLRQYYDTVLPRKGKILDFCSSWVSHYPKPVEDAAANGELQVCGTGMNQAELDANKVLNSGRILKDLNTDPDISGALQQANVIDSSEESKLDSATVVVSIDYLVKPVEVLSSLLDATKTGGSVHLTISNRCFPTKAITRWLRVDQEERLQMVGDFLHFAGWKDIEMVELSDGKVGQSSQEQVPDRFQGLMSYLGMGHRDPLWVVRAVKG
ncbi:hypothetical protein AC579_6369 [Pseudocercospora musae]|uniref:non-specific serine/threonine protein kinase n=1 Tax=Pseudocercospora musae TaxID=113226 RepID=A0A139IJ41_9PEZI|nr:hypothetical protein AC579_6369 [Pseudocercospora musae]